MPDGISVLRRLGIEIPVGIGFNFRGIRFANSRSSVVADFPNGFARGLRRTILHPILVQQAEKLGVWTIWNAKHVSLTARGVSVNDDLIEAQLIIGADGQNSQIRRQAGLDRIKHETRRYGFRRHYRISPWSDYMELHWGQTSQVYVTPVAPDEICVASISRNAHQRLDDALRESPELNQRLKDAVALGPEVGALSVSRTLEAVRRNNVVLIGDASGSVDAITGEGMCLAFHQAIAIADAVERGHLEAYDRVHRNLMKRPRWMASLMLTLERNSGFQRRALAGLAQHPEIFKSLLAIHVGAAQFRDLWSLPLLNFGRTFLTA
jgi:flavin-dependent dehydrogenase